MFVRMLRLTSEATRCCLPPLTTKMYMGQVHLGVSAGLVPLGAISFH